MNENIAKQIEALNPWFYDLTIGRTTVIPGIGSPHSPEQLISDTQYKREILVDAIAKRYNFRGKKILDIASNCGYWSSYYANLGAAYLLAVEGREKFVAQGNLYWQYGQFSQNTVYQFLLGDINNKNTWKIIKDRSPFDFTLCCGILYHIQDHHLLLQRIASVTREAILIDTRISDQGSHDTNPFTEIGDWKFDGIDRPNGKKALAAHPTLDSLQNFFINHHYDIEIIRSSTPVHRLMYPKDNYDLGRRVTLLCKRK